MAQGMWQYYNVVRRHKSGWRRFFLWALIMFTVGGCQESQKTQTLDPLQQCLRQQQELHQQLEDSRQRNVQLEQELAALRQFPAGRMDYLVRVERIEFGRYTGGYDDDKDGRDDRIKFYLVLRDQDDDVIKAAGEADLEIWDLAQSEQSCLYRRHIPLEELGRCWLGGFLADHFKIEIPFTDNFIPIHNDLTVKITFTDALTGKTHLAQKLITVVR